MSLYFVTLAPGVAEVPLGEMSFTVRFSLEFNAADGELLAAHITAMHDRTARRKQYLARRIHQAQATGPRAAPLDASPGIVVDR